MPTPDGKIKVMALVPTMRTGGAERVISLLLQQLDRDRFEPELAIVYDAAIAYPIPDDVPVYVLASEPQPEYTAGVHLPLDLATRFADSAVWLNATAARLVSVVDRRRPDVTISSPLWASILAVVAHDDLPAGTRLVNRVDAPPSVSLAQSDLQDLFAHYMRTYFNRADRVVAVSKAVSRDLVENFGVDAERIQVLPNPVDVRRITELADEPLDDPVFAGGEPVVLFVGRLERVKGLEYLFRAMALVRQSFPAQLALVGDGSQRGYLIALAKHLGIAEHVHFVGRQANPFKYMHRATVFVLPSLSEGMPNVLLEAMAAGCPVIASDIAGGISREVLEEGRYGLIVPREDEASLARAILTMLRDAKLRTRFIQEGFGRAAEFDLPGIMQRNQDLLLSVAQPDARVDGAAVPRRVDVKRETRTTPGDMIAGLWRKVSAVRLVSRMSSGWAVLRRYGLRGLVARLRQELQYAIAVRSTRERLPEQVPALQDAGLTGKIRLLLVVSTLGDAGARSGPAVLLRHLDRETYDISVVGIYASAAMSAAPDNIHPHVLRPVGGPVVDHSGVLPSELITRYRKDLARIDAAARGLSALARELGADAIVADGFYAALLATIARPQLPQTAVVGLVRSRAQDFSGGVPLGELHAALLRGYLGNADHVVVPDESHRADAVEHFRVDEARVTVIPDPIDVRDQGTAVGQVEHPWFDQDVPVFVCDARENQGAGLSYLVQAVALARTRHSIRCMIVAESGQHAELGRLLSEAGVADAVALLPDEVDIRALVPHAVALVEPTASNRHGIPEAIVDAMALGCPVIATRSSAETQSLLGDGVFGLLVPMKDAGALADAMLQLVWDAGLRDSLARGGPQRLRPLLATDIAARYRELSFGNASAPDEYYVVTRDT